MMMNRTTRLAAVPAVLAALALSACQEEAPSAAPPSPASPTQQQDSGAGESQASEGGEPEATATATAAPETSQAPSPGGSGSASGKCTSTDLFKIQRGSVSPKPLNEPQRVKKDYGDGEAEVSIGRPDVDTAGGDTFFPGDGYQVVVFPVTIKAVKGSYVISELHFGLTDGSDEPCKRDVLNKVVPKADEVPVDTLQEGHSKRGKIGFAVPAGAKLADYTVVYAENYSGGKADVAWKAD